MAARKLEIAEGCTAAANGCVGARDPDAIDLDPTLNGANAEGDVFSFGFLVDDLCFQHLRRLCLFALVDLGILLDAVLVILQLDQANEDGSDLGGVSKAGEPWEQVSRTIPQASTYHSVSIRAWYIVGWQGCIQMSFSAIIPIQ